MVDGRPNDMAAVNRPSARIGSAIAFALTGALLATWTGRRFGSAAALGTALAWLSMPRVFGHAHFVSLEMPLVFFSVMSIITWIAAQETGKRSWIVIAGVCCGLAWLTKLPALYLVPFTLLALGGRYLLSVGRLRLEGPALWVEIKAFLLWLVLACLTFYLLWPAMWVRPGFVLSELLRVSSWGIGQPHRFSGEDVLPMQFFMGRPVSDPGPGYYPLLSLFRMSPVVFAFLPVSVVAVVASQMRRILPKPKAMVY